MDYSPTPTPHPCHQAPLSLGFSSKNTGMGFHFLLQGIFQTQGSNPRLLHLLYWQACSLSLEPPGKPEDWVGNTWDQFKESLSSSWWGPEQRLPFRGGPGQAEWPTSRSPVVPGPWRRAAQGKHGLTSCSGFKRVASRGWLATVFPAGTASFERRSEWCTSVPSTSTVSFWWLCNLTQGSCFFQTKLKNPLVGHLPQLSWDTFLEDQLGACVFLLRCGLYLLSWFRRLSTEELMLFKLWAWIKLLRVPWTARRSNKSPLDCQEIKRVNPKGNQPWILVGRTDAETEAPSFWPPDANSWLLGKDLDVGKVWRQKEKGGDRG